MRWLVRLVTPPGGVVLDCFLGSGSTGVAAVLEGFGFIGLDLEREYLGIARARIAHAAGPAGPVERPGPVEPVEAATEPPEPTEAGQMKLL